VNNTVLDGFLAGAWNVIQNLPTLRPRLLGSTNNSPLPLFARHQRQDNSRHGRTPVRWTPADKAAIHQHIKGAILHFTISVNRNVGVGFLLMDILRGRDNLNTNEATFGGTARTHIHNVSPHPLILPANVSFHVRPFPSQWPGYSCWTLQVHTRDETYARNLITLAKFGTRISNSVAEFLNVSFISSSIVIIDRAFPSAMHGEWSRGRPQLEIRAKTSFEQSRDENFD